MTTEELLQRILDKSAEYASKPASSYAEKNDYLTAALALKNIHFDLTAEHLATEAAKDEQLMEQIKPTKP